VPGLIITGVGMLAQHDAGGRIGGKALADAAIISGGHNSTPNEWLQHCLTTPEAGSEERRWQMRPSSVAATTAHPMSGYSTVSLTPL
jgi:hypothetical protein